MEYKFATSRDGSRLFSVATSPRAGGIPLLFVPGLSVTSAWWRKQFTSALLRDHFMVSFDLRGHGASDKPAQASAYQQSVLWAQDIQAVMDAWEIDRVVLVGWSYGGHAVCDYQRHYGQER